MNDTHSCTTTTAFSVDGIDDGRTLIQHTYHLLTAGTSETDASGIRFDKLGTAFRVAFESVSGAPTPRDVAAAIEDGLYFTRRRYEGTDADLRTVVVPDFYREVAGFRCAYR